MREAFRDLAESFADTKWDAAELESLYGRRTVFLDVDKNISIHVRPELPPVSMTDPDKAYDFRYLEIDSRTGCAAKNLLRSRRRIAPLHIAVKPCIMVVRTRGRRFIFKYVAA